MGNWEISILFLPIAVIAIAIIFKWFRDFHRLMRAEYDQAIEYTHEQYLIDCRDMLNRIYCQSEMEDRYRE
jgi:hypothetical protein